MILTVRRSTDLRAALARLLAMVALFAACAHTAAAQSGAAPDKSAAVRRLYAAASVRKNAIALFEAFISRYQKNWPDAVIAGSREKRLFDGFTPGQTRQMEKLIHEFSDRIFAEVNKRVAAEVLTDDNLVSLSTPVFEKYLDDEDLARLTDFLRTPTGQKLVEVGSKHMSDAVLSVLEAKDFFHVSSDPEEEVRRINRITSEWKAGGLSADVRQRLAGLAVSLPAEFTPEELRELAAFWQSPLGAKLIENYPSISTEVFQRNAAVNAPRAGQIAGEVVKEQVEFLKERTAEIFKDAAPTVRGAARKRGN
jgi:hypothetical protein